MTKQNHIVYKYRDWGNCYHQSILLNNQLFLASPEDFNDPFDCRINSNFKLLTKEEEDKYINELAIKGFGESEKRGKDFRKVLQDFEKRFSDKKTFQKEANSLLYEYQDESYAIFSCAMKWNNILMWSHYANHHKGFCVGFWAEKMKDTRIFGKLGEVRYSQSYPKIKPRVAKKDDKLIYNSFLETHTKAKDWVYESEYRFMSNHFPKKLTFKDRLISISDDLFAEIILGINISPKDKNEILNICRAKKIRIYQAEKVDFKFKMKRRRLK